MKLTRAPFRYTLLTFALLALLLAGFLWAQTDTPIIISDGSLTMESRGVAWSQFGGTGNSRRHPNSNKTVSAVDVTVNGNTQTIPFTGQRCTVTAQYGTTNITVSTGGNGKSLQVSTDFTKFHPGASPNHMAHADEHSKIGAVTVRKGNQTAFSGTGNGGTVITIHYQ